VSNVILVLDNVIKHLAMKTYSEVEVRIAPPVFTSALDGGEWWSASRPYRFNQGDRTTGPHWIGGWADPKADLDAMKMREKNSYP
jgi:hypothetical protein